MIPFSHDLYGLLQQQRYTGTSGKLYEHEH